MAHIHRADQHRAVLNGCTQMRQSLSFVAAAF
jgi:hypothetical protein